MDARERAELEVLASWVDHPGWDVFARRTEERITQWREGAPFNIKNGDELVAAKAQIAVLREFLELKDRVLALRDNPDESTEEE